MNPMYYFLDSLPMLLFWGVVIFILFKIFKKKTPSSNVSPELFTRLVLLLEQKGILTSAELYGSSAVNPQMVASMEVQNIDNTILNTQSPQVPMSAPFISATPEVIATSEETGAKWLGRLGIIAILIGFSFFLTVIVGMVGPVGKIIIGVLVGITLLVAGQMMREKYGRYSDLILSGGIGILYLTIFSSFALYHLVGQPLAFVLMSLVTILAVTLSIIGGTMNLATLGVVGGFLTPYLISTGESNLVGLSIYMLILDIGVLGVSFMRKWDSLNYLGFVGTVILFGGWFFRFYTQEQLGITFIFGTAFFLVYLVSSVIHNIYNRKISTEGDTILATINAFIYFGFIYAIFHPQNADILGFFALVLAVVYFTLGYVARLNNPEDQMMNIYLPGLAIAFLSVAIPLQVSGYWITLAWLIESLVLFAVALETKRATMRFFAGLVFILGVVRLFVIDLWNSVDLLNYTIIFNRHMFMLAVAILVAYGIVYLYNRASRGLVLGKSELGVMAVFMIFANVATVFTLTLETSRFYDREIAEISLEYRSTTQNNDTYRGNTSGYNQNGEDYRAMQSKISDSSKQRDVVISILWALYAVALLVVGFISRIRLLRLLGLALFFITAIKIFFTMWNLGGMYPFFAFFIFGSIALGGSFAYEKFKHRINEVL